jgi:alkanesulfonate monooxygenase SsuD/methylene tetrahydromethanopterin reductase-like flavin-dependent oxidoreductase (luciferase family)
MTTASRVNLGVLLSGTHSSPVEMASWAVSAEKKGFDSVWVNESTYDVIVPLTIIGHATSRVRLGAACAIVGRPPHVAQLAISGLEQVSGGRLCPAFSDGPSGPNRSWFGPRPRSSLKRMREYIEVLRLMLSAHDGEAVRYEGEYYQVENYRRLSAPVRDTVPLLVGASGPRMIELAGALADGIVAPALNCRAFFDEIAFPGVAAGLATRPTCQFERASVRICSVDDDADRARARAKRQIAFYVGIAPSLARMLDLLGFAAERSEVEAAFLAGDVDAATALVPEASIEDLVFAGTPAECRAQLDDFADGLDTVILYPPAAGLNKQESDRAHAALLDAFA